MALEALHAWQRYYNMEPRDDSKLTRLFVEGKVDWPVDVVARELMATDFIYKNTLYGEVIEEFMRGVADRLKRKHRLSWTATWDVVRFYAPIALKLMLLDRCGVRIPEALGNAAVPGGTIVGVEGMEGGGEKEGGKEGGMEGGGEKEGGKEGGRKEEGGEEEKEGEKEEGGKEGEKEGEKEEEKKEELKDELRDMEDDMEIG